MINKGTANGSAPRIELLRAKEKQIREALAIEQTRLAKRQKRETEKEQSIIGAAVVKAAALSPEFRLAVAQAALCNVAEDKQRRFLVDRGWKI